MRMSSDLYIQNIAKIITYHIIRDKTEIKNPRIFAMKLINSAFFPPNYGIQSNSLNHIRLNFVWALWSLILGEIGPKDSLKVLVFDQVN